MGEWNVYDIFFEAPRFEGEKVVKLAYMTVVFNGERFDHAILQPARSREPITRAVAVSRQFAIRFLGRAENFVNVGMGGERGVAQTEKTRETE